MKSKAILTILLLAFWTFCSNAARAEDKSRFEIEYSTPAKALKTLTKKYSANSFRQEDGWLVLPIVSESTQWYVADKYNPAYPTVIKRVLYADDAGKVQLSFAMKCKAKKKLCDSVRENFIASSSHSIN